MLHHPSSKGTAPRPLSKSLDRRVGSPQSGLRGAGWSRAPPELRGAQRCLLGDSKRGFHGDSMGIPWRIPWFHVLYMGILYHGDIILYHGDIIFFWDIMTFIYFNQQEYES